MGRQVGRDGGASESGINIPIRPQGAPSPLPHMTTQREIRRLCIRKQVLTGERVRHLDVRPPGPQNCEK